MPKLSALPVIMMLLLLLATTVDGQQPRRGRGRGPFAWRGMNIDAAFLVAMRDVQEELKLTTQQRELLESIQLDLADQRRGTFRGGPPGARPGEAGSEEEARRRFQQLSQQGEKLVMAVLEPSQAERLRQIRLQWDGVRALERDEVAGPLALTESQQKEIHDILSGESMAGNAREGTNPSREERETRQGVLDSRVMAVLSDKQKQNWERMKGKKFDLSERTTRFGPRGFRGRGGGGRPPRSQRP